MSSRHRTKHNLQLGEYFLDVSEAAFRDVKVFVERSTLEDRLRSILKELCKREKFFYFLHLGMLQSTNV